jgi:hypothetical protein
VPIASNPKSKPSTRMEVIGYRRYSKVLASPIPMIGGSR